MSRAALLGALLLAGCASSPGATAPRPSEPAPPVAAAPASAPVRQDSAPPIEAPAKAAPAAPVPKRPPPSGKAPTTSTAAEGRFATFEPSSGKSSGPIGLRVRYPQDHPKNQPLPVTVELWATDGAADSLELTLRPDPSLQWGAGPRTATFAGPIPQGEKRSFQFTVTPTKDGKALVAIDAARVRAGQRASRTVALLVNGGGAVSSNGVPEDRVRQ